MVAFKMIFLLAIADFALAQQQQLNLPRTPYPRMLGSAIATDGKMVLLGGNLRNDSLLSSDPTRAQLGQSIGFAATVFSYATFSTVDVPISIPSNMPNRLNVTGQTCDYSQKSRRIYCFGGRTVVKSGAGGSMIPGLGIFDPQAMAWEANVPVDVPLRWGHSSVLIGGTLYVFGGWTGAPSTFSDFWSIDLTSFKSTSLGFTNLYSPSPPPRQYACLVPVSSSSFLLLGGQNSSRVYGDSWLYDIPYDRWTETTAWFSDLSPGQRSGMSCTNVNGRAWVFGGENASGTFLNDLWILDAQRWTWFRKQDNMDIVNGVDNNQNDMCASQKGVSCDVVGKGNGTAAESRSAPSIPPTAAPGLATQTVSSAVSQSTHPPQLHRRVPQIAPSQPAASPGPPSRRAFQLSASIGQYLIVTGGATAFDPTANETYPTDRFIYFYDTIADGWVQDVKNIPALALYVQGLGDTGMSSTKRYILIAAVAVGGAILLGGFVGGAAFIAKRHKIKQQAAAKDRKGAGLNPFNDDSKQPPPAHDVIRLSNLYPIAPIEKTSELEPLVRSPTTLKRPEYDQRSLSKSRTSVKGSAYINPETEHSGRLSLDHYRPFSDPGANKICRDATAARHTALYPPPISTVPPAHVPKPPRLSPSSHSRHSSKPTEETETQEDPKRLTLGSVFGSAGSRTSKGSRVSKASTSR
ncbi:hypothetical protein SpCBS45565_g01457 [Spizellomyces sp. 'palustris']|nr:hypothetical protein SpCBS45565_g01457 [Spizellomyces sp. 'palustris']